ncbi:MAG: CvpA family protein [Clostridia bacterium]
MVKTMGIIVDIIIVAILLLFIIVGYRKGLTGSLIKLASFAIALVLAFILYKPLANMAIENTQIDEKIETAIITTFGAEKTEETENTESQMPKTMLESISSDIENATQEAKNEIIQNTAKEVTLTIMYVGSGLVVFIVARFVLFIISLFAKGITSLPLIKQIDRLGGIVYGAIEGLVIIFAVLGIISFMAIVWVDNPVIPAITKSTIGSILYNNNILLNIIF